MLTRTAATARRMLCALACALLVLLADGGLGFAASTHAGVEQLTAASDCCGEVCTCRSASASSCCTAGGQAKLLVVAPCGCGHHEGGSVWQAQRVPWGLPTLALARAAQVPPRRSNERDELAPATRQPAPGAPVPRG